MARLPDAVQRAVQMGKLVELHTGSASTFDHPLLQVVRGVGVVIQNVSEQGVLKPLQEETFSYLDFSSTV